MKGKHSFCPDLTSSLLLWMIKDDKVPRDGAVITVKERRILFPVDLFPMKAERL
jgi:hypothetical protein